MTLYDYHYNPQPPHTPEVKLTDSGRQVYGGGGITPDVVAPVAKPGDFQDVLLRRGVFYPLAQGVGDFVRFYLGSKPEINKNFVPDDAVIAQLRKFFDQQHIKYAEQDIQANLTWLKWQIESAKSSRRSLD